MKVIPINASYVANTSNGDSQTLDIIVPAAECRCPLGKQDSLRFAGIGRADVVTRKYDEHQTIYSLAMGEGDATAMVSAIQQRIKNKWPLPFFPTGAAMGEGTNNPALAADGNYFNSQRPG